MGQCKYCGEDAGFFSHVHKECEEKHKQGVMALEDGQKLTMAIPFASA